MITFEEFVQAGSIMNAVDTEPIQVAASTQYGCFVSNNTSDLSAGSNFQTTSSRSDSKSDDNENKGDSLPRVRPSSSPSQEVVDRVYTSGTIMSLNNITHGDLNSAPESAAERLPKRPRIPQEPSLKTWLGKSRSNIEDEPPSTTSEISGEANLEHMEMLALGMIKLFLSYNSSADAPASTLSGFPASDSPTPQNSGGSTRSGSDGGSDGSFGSDKVKHDIITTLRDTVPLGYLQGICKKHDISNVRWYPCTHPHCFNLYLSKGSQRRHTYSHTGERPYSCQFPGCDKSYSASDRLAEHMHSHTNQRPYRCPIPGCSKAYNDPKTLREHKRTHGDKTFICTVSGCNKAFHRKTHLKQHLRTHNSEESAGPFMETDYTQHRSLLNDSTNSHFTIFHRSPNHSS